VKQTRTRCFPRNTFRRRGLLPAVGRSVRHLGSDISRLCSVARVFLVVIGLAGIGTPPALAQQDTVAGPRFREAFASISDGHTVKVLQPSGTTVGQYSGIVGDSLVLVANEGPATTLALDDVTAAWTRKHNTGKGALIGGIAGVVIGGILGGLATGFCESSCNSTAGNVVVGALVVGLPSAAIGALIGAAIPGWKQIGPR